MTICESCHAGTIAPELAQVERLRHDALPGERRVAVNEQRDDGVVHVAARHLGLVFLAQQVLLGAYHAFDDRVDSFEVARVRGQGRA